jgi:hypothetical protein
VDKQSKTADSARNPARPCARRAGFALDRPARTVEETKTADTIARVGCLVSASRRLTLAPPLQSQGETPDIASRAYHDRQERDDFSHH